MTVRTESCFLVDSQTDPIVIQVVGRASYLNSAPLNDLFPRCIKHGSIHFVLNFVKCTGMDSTFLGILASMAMHLIQRVPQGSITLYKLNQRNLELVTNLGLHKLLKIENSTIEDFEAPDEEEKPVPCLYPEYANPDLILKAHEALIAAHPSNMKHFEDVVTFLRRQIDAENMTR